MERAAEEDEKRSFGFLFSYFVLIFSMLIVVFRRAPKTPCYRIPGTAIGKRRTGTGTCAGIKYAVSGLAPQPPAPSPFAFQLPSPLPRPDCNRVNIEPGRHMRDEHSPESAFQASATRAGHMAGQPCAAPVRTKSGQSPRTFPHTNHTQTHRVTAQDRVREARQPGACADKS